MELELGIAYRVWPPVCCNGQLEPAITAFEQGYELLQDRDPYERKRL
ncbi:MAG: hypothetical protein R2911_32145 [Caldilineaceae bacterium]